MAAFGHICGHPGVDSHINPDFNILSGSGFASKQAYWSTVAVLRVCGNTKNRSGRVEKMPKSTVCKVELPLLRCKSYWTHSAIGGSFSLTKIAFYVPFNSRVILEGVRKMPPGKNAS